jgi:hypothetical protein
MRLPSGPIYLLDINGIRGLSRERAFVVLGYFATVLQHLCSGSLVRCNIDVAFGIIAKAEDASLIWTEMKVEPDGPLDY